MYELWKRRSGGPWRSLRTSDSEPALKLAAQKEADDLREAGSPWQTDFLVAKLGEIPLGHEEPTCTVHPSSTRPSTHHARAEIDH